MLGDPQKLEDYMLPVGWESMCSFLLWPLQLGTWRGPACVWDVGWMLHQPGCPLVLAARCWVSPCSLSALAGVRERQQRGPVRDPLPAEGDSEPDPVAAELCGECRGCHRRANQPRQVCRTSCPPLCFPVDFGARAGGGKG